MKKLISVLVMAIFVLSLLPTAIAQDQIRSQERIQAVQVISTNETPIPAVLPAKAELLRVREIAREKLQAARERYQAARERYIQAKERYQETKQKITSVRTTLRACKDAESEGCLKLRRQIRIHSGEFLLNIADRVLETLEKIKSKVESNEDLTEEEASDLLAKIEAKITEVSDAKGVIENLTNESSAEEIREAARTIKQAWKNTRVVLKKSVGRLVNARIGGIIVKLEHLKTKLIKISSRIEEAGENVRDLDELIDKFHSELEEAKNKWQLAKEKYAEAVTPGKIDELMKEANKYLREAHEKLKEAHKTLKEILIKIREKKGAEEALIAVETEESPVDVEPEIEKIECLENEDCDEEEVCENGRCVKVETVNKTEDNQTE